MATQATISIQNANFSVTGIYHHFDGHLDSLGAELFEKYTTEKSILELIVLGDCSSIMGDSVVAYHRDKGEDWEGVKPKTFQSWKLFHLHNSQEYNYLFTDGAWYVSKGSDTLTKLTARNFR